MELTRIFDVDEPLFRLVATFVHPFDQVLARARVGVHIRAFAKLGLIISGRTLVELDLHALPATAARKGSLNKGCGVLEHLLAAIGARASPLASSLQVALVHELVVNIIII